METIYWELIRYIENKKYRGYKIIDTAETSIWNPDLPIFGKQRNGDILLGHKDGGLEAYVVEV